MNGQNNNGKSELGELLFSIGRMDAREADHFQNAMRLIEEALKPKPAPRSEEEEGDRDE